MVGRNPEQHIDAPMSLQRWDTLTFVHWSYDPHVVRPLVPDNLELDLYQGRAWVSLTPFVMTDVRVPGTPPVPGLSTFPEANVRTYVRNRAGLDALYFLTLECTRSATLAARAALQLPYAWAAMTVEIEGLAVRYRSARRLPPSAAAWFELHVAVDDALPDSDRGPLDDWLTGRWRAFHGYGRARFCTRVEHQPWPLARATVTTYAGDILEAVGLPPPDQPPLVHFSPGVDVRLDRPRRLR